MYAMPSSHFPSHNRLFVYYILILLFARYELHENCKVSKKRELDGKLQKTAAHWNNIVIFFLNYVLEINTQKNMLNNDQISRISVVV